MALQKLVINCSSGKSEYLDLTPDEIVKLEQRREEARIQEIAEKVEEEARAARKAAKDALREKINCGELSNKDVQDAVKLLLQD